MTTGEWSCLISFTWAPLTCSERGGSEKFKMKIFFNVQLSIIQGLVYSYLQYSFNCCMINRIWSLKPLWLQVNGHAWFHLHELRWPVRNGEGAKNSKWKFFNVQLSIIQGLVYSYLQYSFNCLRIRSFTSHQSNVMKTIDRSFNFNFLLVHFTHWHRDQKHDRIKADASF